MQLNKKKEKKTETGVEIIYVYIEGDKKSPPLLSTVLIKGMKVLC